MSATQTQTQTATKNSVLTELNFYNPVSLVGEKPHNYMYDDHEGPQRNYGDVTHIAPIHDIRGHESEFSLDKNGFQVVKSPTAEKDFKDEEKIQKEYYKEVEDLLKKVTGAHKVVIFDHTIRRSITGQIDKPTSRGPVGRVHIDQTPWAGEE